MPEKKFLGKTFDELISRPVYYRGIPPLPKPQPMKAKDVTGANMPLSRDIIKLDDVIKKYKANGKGFCAALIDSGVAKHRDINAAISKRVSCNGRKRDIYDTFGHGTHIAGLIAGRGSNTAGKGVASQAKILSLKVTDADGGDASWHSIFNALNEVISRVDRWTPKDGPMISVVNLSINSHDNDIKPSHNIHNHKLIKCIEHLHDMNVPVVVSSGNNFERYHTYGLAYPAYYNKLISVGAVVNFPFEDGYYMDTIAPFSQRIEPEQKTTSSFILAPGVLSVSLDIAKKDKNGICYGYGYMTGTSLAAPIVTGIILLMQEIYINTRHSGKKKYKYLPPVTTLQQCLTRGSESITNIPHGSRKRSPYYDGREYKRINTVNIIKELKKI